MSRVRVPLLTPRTSLRSSATRSAGAAEAERASPRAAYVLVQPSEGLVTGGHQAAQQQKSGGLGNLLG